ncbi:hypothetical protein RHO12_11600 [Orbus sturtevantii]
MLKHRLKIVGYALKFHQPYLLLISSTPEKTQRTG